MAFVPNAGCSQFTEGLCKLRVLVSGNKSLQATLSQPRGL